jgi:hypothetical protein
MQPRQPSRGDPVRDSVAIHAGLVDLPRGDRQVLAACDRGQYFVGHAGS